MTQTAEKRENQRIPLDTPVSYSLNGIVWYDTRSVNINYTGMLLRAEESLMPGQLLHLVFRLPNVHRDEIIETKGEVIRIATRRSKQVGVAVHFMYLHPAHQKVIQKFINRVSR